MNLEQRPGTTQIQKLSLTPEMRQSLIILQLPVVELQGYVSQQVIENCLLEYETDAATGDSEGLFATDQPIAESLENVVPGDPLAADWNNTNYGMDSALKISEINIISPDYAQFSLSGETSLRDYLLFQLHISPVTPRQMIIGEYLIENINHDGYLAAEPEETAQSLGMDCAEVDAVVQIIQTFEPPGVAARNLSECLRIQLIIQKNSFENPLLHHQYDLALYITDNHLSEVAEGRMKRILKNINQPMAEVTQAVELIKRLDPKPGRNFGNNDKPNYIFPDVTVIKNDHHFVIEVTEISPVKLQVNHYYRQLLNQQVHADSEAIDFLKERYHKALWIMKCLEQRKNTLHKITAAIVEVQQEFLQKGLPGLRPLTLQKIAVMVGLDESTVSRAIHGKYILTPQGMYALKYFFASGVRSEDGASVSSKSIQRLIREIIAVENPAAPLSDQQLTEMLNHKGFHISRRTVTKYREAILIPSSNKRRKYL